ncbi:MAG: hypothetical protein KGJ89_05095 [Patescibacteria group bacterium]|nr:hypothetical protein [Patescibacteria group bacterium]MDE2227298.1 hypothetical protein [Patescibacteria group bacterium]
MSKDADGYSLAHKFSEDDHQVYFWTQNPKYRIVGKGLNNPKPISEWQPYVNGVDIIIFDMVGMGKIASALKKMGKPVLGGSILADQIEEDRAYAQKVMKKYTGASIPEFKEFTNIMQGIAYLENAENPHVFKPLNNAPNSWTFVAKDDNEGLISFMEALPKQSLPYILQEKVDGIEISTEGWFNGKEFIDGGWNHTFERKRLMNGDIGPQTGSQGAIIFANGENRLVKEFVKPLEKFLRANNYVGPIDVNCIVNKDSAYFLEFCGRFGYHGIEPFCLLLKDDKADFFMNMAKGKNIEFKLNDEYSIAIRLSMNPLEGSDDLKGLKVLDMPGYLSPYVWLSYCIFDKEKNPLLSGADGMVGAVCTTGETIDDVREEVYDIIDTVSLTQDLQYRTDIGAEVPEKMEKLIKWGWLNE